MNYPRVSSFKSSKEFRDHLQKISLQIDLTDEVNPQSFAQACKYKNKIIGNRCCILPMEGWDCLPDGNPSDLTKRRWMNFATSGAKLLFGCEAAAVMQSSKSNTRQMMINENTYLELKELLQEMRSVHAEKFGTADDLYIGLQLTHSGRYSHPNDDAKRESVTAYSNPLLDKRFANTAENVVTDEEIPNIIEHFVKAAHYSYLAGFDFVDIKMAHGYLGFEFLAAIHRPGLYGGSFENRTRFFREIVEGIQKEVPELDIATRLSLFDFIPFEKGEDQVGKAMRYDNYPYAFSGDGTGLGYDLSETCKFIELCKNLGIEMICATAGSPYYNPHIQRPAYFPVSDGYLAPEEPLVGVARQIMSVAEVKKRFPELIFISSGLTALQEYLPNVANWILDSQFSDFIGIGRMVLAYPDFFADLLAGKDLNKRRICRTIGDCTTAPRNGLVSGCYPLDEFYKGLPEFEELKQCKKGK